jgi:hypothetical protein
MYFLAIERRSSRLAGEQEILYSVSSSAQADNLLIACARQPDARANNDGARKSG